MGDLEEDTEDETVEADEEHDIVMPDCYRGRITAETVSDEELYKYRIDVLAYYVLSEC